MKKNVVLLSSLVLLASCTTLVSSSQFQHVFGQETTTVEQNETTTLPVPTLPTREEAVEIVHETNFQEAFPKALRYMGVADDIIASISEEHLFEAAVTYKMTHIPGGDDASLSNYFVAMYPEYFRDRYTTVEQVPTLPTREEAIEYVEQYKLQDNFPEALVFMGVPEEVVAKIPEEDFYDAAVLYVMTNIPTGNNSSLYLFFVQMYPDYFKAEEVSEVEEKQQEKNDTIAKNQDTLMEAQEKNKTEKNYLELEDNHEFKFDKGTYKITSVYLLTPNEAGNQTDEYMLGINYELTNNSEEAISPDENELRLHSNVTQIIDETRISMSPAQYQLPDENVEEATETEEIAMIEVNETFEGALYYNIPEKENDLVFSVIQNDSVEEYLLSIEDLMNLPYQSASYTTNDENLLGIIFDFETLYLVNKADADLSDWENKEETTTNISPEEISPEAKIQYDNLLENLNGETPTLVEIKKISYSIEENKISAKSTNDETLFELMTEDNWQSFMLDESIEALIAE